MLIALPNQFKLGTFTCKVLCSRPSTVGANRKAGKSAPRDEGAKTLGLELLLSAYFLGTRLIDFSSVWLYNGQNGKKKGKLFVRHKIIPGMR